MSSSIPLRGIRTGTPIPRDDREATSGAGPCITYQAPPEMLERYRNMPGRNRKKTGEESTVTTMTLTREQYLDERRGGKTRADIAKEQRITAAGLLYHLTKWGLKDSAVESAQLQATTTEESAAATTRGLEYSVTIERPDATAHRVKTEPEQREVDDLPIMPDVPTQYVTIRLMVPTETPHIPIEIRTMDRAQTLADALAKLAACVQWVTSDARDLTGQHDVTAMVQAYVERAMTQ